MNSFLSTTAPSIQKRRLLIFLILPLFLLFGGAVYFYMLSTSQQETTTNHISSYSIDGVPYVGLHNNQDIYKQPHMLCDTGSAIISLVEYWQPQKNDISEIFSAFPFCRNYTLEEVTTFLSSFESEEGLRYSLDSKRMELNELTDYVHGNSQTPLITFLPIAEDQPSNLYYYPTVVIHSIDAENQVVIFHDYWHGPNRKLTFTEYQRLQEKLPPDLKQRYLVVQPEDFHEPSFTFPESDRPYLATIPEAVTGQDGVLEEQEIIFNDLALAEGAYGLEFFDLAEIYFQRLVRNPRFETEFPRAWQVWILFRYADTLGNGLHEYEDALEIVTRAEEINYNLGEGQGYFDSFDYLFTSNSEGNRDKLSFVYIVKGDIYRHQGNIQEAIDAYEMALEIFPHHQSPQRIIEQLQERL